MPDGSKLPYFVVGAGGHPLLEKVDPDKDPRLLAGSRHRSGWSGDGELELAAFNDTHHGFLRVTVSATHVSTSYLTVPSSLHPEWSIADAAREADRCVFRLPTASRSPATG
jgi:hypothetical protein